MARTGFAASAASYYPASAAAIDERKRQARQSNNSGGNRGRRNNGGWTPRVVGTVGNTDKVVTLREGLGDNDGYTLIADGDKSKKDFDANHNHYGQKREGGGRVNEDRGHYTGPEH